MGSFSCPLCCESKFKSCSALRQHLSFITNDVFTCPQCEKDQLTLLDFMDHLQVHTKEEEAVQNCSAQLDATSSHEEVMEIISEDYFTIMEEVTVADSLVKENITDTSFSMSEEVSIEEEPKECRVEDEMMDSSSVDYCCSSCGRFFCGSEALIEHEVSCSHTQKEKDINDDPSVTSLENDLQQLEGNNYTVHDPEKTVLLVVPTTNGRSFSQEPKDIQLVFKSKLPGDQHGHTYARNKTIRPPTAAANENASKDKDVFICISTSADQPEKESTHSISCSTCHQAVSMDEWKQHLCKADSQKQKTAEKKKWSGARKPPLQAGRRGNFIECEACNKDIPKLEWSKHMTLLVMCELCNKYVNHALIDKHMEWLHSNTSVFVCGTCAAEFHLASVRLQHMEHVHFEEQHLFSTKEKPNLSSSSIQALQEQAVSNGKHFLCPFCRNIYLGSDTIRKHLRLHMSKVPTSCMYCPRRFESPLACWEHEHSHINQNDKPFLCSFCSETFASPDERHLHTRGHVDCSSDAETEAAVQEICEPESTAVMNSNIICKSCDQEVDPKEWQLHMRLEVRCDVCCKHVDHTHLDRHVASKHANVQLLRCHLCEETFPLASQKLRHSTLHVKHVSLEGTEAVESGSNETTENFSCPICGRIFVRRQWFKMHLSNHTSSSRMFQCSKCCREFKTEAALIRHESIHPTMNKFMCNYCPRTYRNMVDLKLHMFCHLCQSEIPQDFSMEATFPGEEMGDKEEESSALELLQCETCNARVPRDKFVQHAQLLVLCEICQKGVPHMELDVHMSGHEGVEEFPCHMCQEKFPTAVKRLQHSKECHNEISVALQAGPEQTLICPVCNKILANRLKLSAHLRRHTGEKPYTCANCGQGFFTRNDAWRHQQHKHTFHRPHQCTLCPKAFCSRDQLKAHLRTHDVRRPHACPICGRTFKTASCRNVHLQTHSVERSHCCTLCGKGCKTRSHLWNHMQHHKKPYQCSVCAKRMYSQHALKAHMRRHLLPNGNKQTNKKSS